MSRFLLLTLLCFALLAACERGDDASTSSGQATDDDGSPADDDVSPGDDDDGPLTLQVTLSEVPAGNPLARKLRVQSSRACSLTGWVTTAGEPGYGPSSPAATPNGTTHELLFAGLLAETAFAFHLATADDPSQTLVAGEFTTGPAPERAPLPTEVFSSGDERPDRWAAMIINTLRGFAPERPYIHYTGLVMAVDRQGRPRFTHLLDAVNYEEREPFLEGMQLLSDGSIAFGVRRSIRVVNWAGTEWELFKPSIPGPVMVSSHHQFRIFEGSPPTAVVMFNLLGDGFDCELNPTDLVAGDGVAWLDAAGAATRRWSVFDHPADFPLDEFGPCGCHEGFWGDGTIDFTHGNNVDPHPDEGAMVISLRNLSRVVKLDVESGDVIWQLGEGADFAWVGDEPAGERWFTDQHDAQLLPNGNLIMFDNGNCRDGAGEPYSRALELAVDQTKKQASLVWQHRVPYAGAMGNVVRLDDGGTFISGGWNGQLVEVSSNDEEIWRLQYPVVMQLPNISHGMPVPAQWVYDQDAP